MAAAPENLTECSNIMKDKTSSLTIQHVTVKMVENHLKNLKPSKSTGVDELDSFSVKMAAKFIAPPVHHIITLSIMQRRFPTSWKLTKLIPLHKKLNRLDPKN